MLRPSLPALLAPLLLLPLAGCFGGGGGGGGGNGGAGGDGGLGGVGDGGGEGGGLQPPAWAVGHWWNYTVSDGFASTRVVTGDLGADWLVETDNPQTAFFDARFDVSSMGPVRKSDLAGSQGSTRVEYYRWPLLDGAAWTTTWDGLPVAITARDLGDGRFQMEGTTNGSLYVRYSYDAAVGSFREMRFYDEEGSEGFTLTLQAHGANYTGPIARWSLETLWSVGGSFGAAQATSFDLAASATDLYLEVRVSCQDASAGALHYELLRRDPPAPDPQAIGITLPCPDQAFTSQPVAVPAGDEQWDAAVLSTPQTPGEWSLLLLQRTLELASFPA